MLQLVGFPGHLDGELFDLKSKLFDLCLISSSVLFESQVVLFFLTRGKCPLLKFLLIPVHLEFELVHALVRLEDHVLNVVKPVLLVCNSLFELFNFILQSSTLALGDLL